MQIKTLMIIIGVILFIVGGMLGFVLGIIHREAVEILTPSEFLITQERKIKELIEHPGLDNICANLVGEITKITEDTIVIINNQKLLELKVDQETHISRRLEIIELVEIQKGEQASIYAAITEQGELVARGISVQ